MTIVPIWVADHTVIPIIPHEHDYYQLMFCKSGSGEMTLDGESYKATGGTVYFSKPGTMHGFVPKDSLQLVEIKFEADEEMTRYLSEIPLVFSIANEPRLVLALNDIVKDGLSKENFSYEATKSRILIFLIELLRAYGVSGGSDQPISRKKERNVHEDREFYKIVNYIDEHLSEDITLDELARTVHFNKSYLIVRFKETWGISPMKYVNYVRIERARELLATTEKSITDIALEVGFSGIHYFSRYFKARVGITPQEYRTSYTKDS